MGEHRYWERLERELRDRAAKFAGVAGIHLRDRPGGRVIDINGNEAFPTASSIDIHLLVALLELDAPREMMALISEGEPLSPGFGDLCLKTLRKPKKGSLVAGLPGGSG